MSHHALHISRLRQYLARCCCAVGVHLLRLLFFVPLLAQLFFVQTALAETPAAATLKQMEEIGRLRQTGQQDSHFVRLLLTASEDLNVPNEAPHLIAEARELYPRFHSAALEADFLYAAGLLARSELRMDAAIDTLRLALDRYLALGLKSKVALAYSRLGLFYHQLGVYATAIEYHLTALSLAEELSYNELIFRQNLHLAHIYNTLNKPHQALDLLSRAKAVMPVETALQRQTALFQYTAESYMLLGKLDTAKMHLEQAFLLARRAAYPDTLVIAFLLGDYAVIAQRLANSTLAQEKLDSAMMLMRLLPLKYDNIRLPLEAARVMYLRAEQEKDPAQKAENYRAAIGYASLNVPTSVRIYRLLMLEIMANSHASLGEFASAYRLQRQYIALRDSIFSTSLEAHIGSVQEHITRSKREKEIESLTNENLYRTRLQYAFASVALVLAALVLVVWNRYRLKKDSEKVVEIMNVNLHSANAQLMQANMLLNHANDELSLAKERAEEVNRMKRTFLDTISHEIRTPLTAIQGYADILMMEITNPEHLHFAERIKASVKHLLLLFEDMIHISKVRGDQTQTDLQPTSLHDLCRQVCAMFEESARLKGIALSAEVSNVLVQHLMLDTAKVRLVLFNLLGNAVKFTESGFVKLIVEPVLESITERKEGTTEIVGIEISVQDSGIGMPEDVVPFIFDSFRHTDVDIHRKYGGLGLGLTICKAFVEIMGGTIKAESTRGEGSIFRVYLPLPSH